MKQLYGLFITFMLIFHVVCETTVAENHPSPVSWKENATTTALYETTQGHSTSSSCNIPKGNKSLQCQYIQMNTDDCEGGGYIDYNAWVHCTKMLPLVIIICIILLIECFIGLSVAANSFLSIAVIVQHLKINENVAGVTIMALANGAPDIFSSVAAVLGSETPKADLSLGALLGSGLFLNTVIVGTVCITNPFTVVRRPTIRDLIFYTILLIWALISMIDGSIQLWNSIGFLAIYFLYVFVVVFGRYINNRLTKRGNDEEPEMPNMDGKPMQTNLQLHQKNPNSSDSVDSQDNAHSEETISTVPSDPEPSENFKPMTLDVEHLPANEDSLRTANHNSQITKQSSMRCRSSTVRPIETLKRQANSLDFEANWAWETISKNEINSVPVIQNAAPVEGHEIRELFKEFLMVMKPFSLAKFKSSKWHKKIRKILQVPIVTLLKLTTPVVNLERPNNNWSKAMAMVHCVLCPQALLIATEYITLMIGGVFPLSLILLLLGLAGAVLVYFTTTRTKIPRFHTAMSYIGFMVAILWIYAFAREIVGILTMIATYSNIPHSILGLTLLAWSNSLGDLICDLSVAKQGFHQMAVSACYGGALFNLAVSIGLSFTIAILKNGQVSFFDFNVSLHLLLMFQLFVSIASFIVFVITKFRASRPYGIFLLCTFVVFLVCVALARVGLLHFLRF